MIACVYNGGLQSSKISVTYVLFLFHDVGTHIVQQLERL